MCVDRVTLIFPTLLLVTMKAACAVVSLHQIFEPGMECATLSRTASLHRLQIFYSDENKMYADPEITTFLEIMRKAEFEHAMPLLYLVSRHV